MTSALIRVWSSHPAAAYLVLWAKQTETQTGFKFEQKVGNTETDNSRSALKIRK